MLHYKVASAASEENVGEEDGRQLKRVDAKKVRGTVIYYLGMYKTAGLLPSVTNKHAQAQIWLELRLANKIAYLTVLPSRFPAPCS